MKQYQAMIEKFWGEHRAEKQETFTSGRCAEFAMALAAIFAETGGVPTLRVIYRGERYYDGELERCVLSHVVVEYEDFRWDIGGSDDTMTSWEDSFENDDILYNIFTYDTVEYENYKQAYKQLLGLCYGYRVPLEAENIERLTKELNHCLS